MAALTEGNRPGDWLIEEFGAPNYCREEHVITGGSFKSGAVLGTSGGKDSEYSNDTTYTAATGILLNDCDASSADKTAVVIVRGPVVVSKAGLTWKSDQHTDDIAAGLADLLALGIVAREGV